MHHHAKSGRLYRLLKIDCMVSLSELEAVVLPFHISALENQIIISTGPFCVHFGGLIQKKEAVGNGRLTLPLPSEIRQ